MNPLIRTITGAGLALGLAACGQADQTAEKSGTAPDYAAMAQRIAHENIIIDSHIDVPYRLEEHDEDVSVATEGGDFDWPRARAGGLDAPFMSIYLPARYQVEGGAKALADHLIDVVEGIAAHAPDKFMVAHSTAEVEDAFARHLIALPMGMENGAGIEDDLANLDHFYKRGIRYITLAHSKSNLISDSSYDDNKQHGGLSPFGEKVVARMMQLGIMIDISHVSDDAFYDVIRLARVPVIASHSSARYFTPGWERNMTDEMIRALAENGGVIQVAIGSAFLTAEANAYSQARGPAREAWLKEKGLDDNAASREAFEKEYRATNPYPYATLDQVLDVFDHVIDVAGIDHVGIGTDFDGVGDSLPVGLKDVSTYPVLIEGLLKRGHSEADIAKILSGNTLRVWKAVEAHAASQASD